MNMILLYPGDFVAGDRVRLAGRRAEHVRSVHRAESGDTLRVGVIDGKMGTGVVQTVTADTVELSVTLTEAPPAPPPITLLLALPRPKCFRRVLQGVVTLGVKRIALFGAYRVEKSYWKTPWLEEAELSEQVTLGLEQARDTLAPVITQHPLFKPFIEDVVPGLTRDTRRLVAHPGAGTPCPCAVPGPVSLAIGPEGGFTDYELGLLSASGFVPITFGPRILRTEQAVPALLGRIMECS